jgi:hypothetical protein
MESPLEPIQIPLTAEQQELIRRMSGQFAQALELTPEPADPTAGEGQVLRFRWRLSTNSGIPRQHWGSGPPTAEHQVGDGG